MTTGHPEHDDSAKDDRRAAMAMLERAGLAPPDDELAAILANYAGFRALSTSLYGVPGTRDELPAISFTFGAPDDTTSGTER